jgi:periplasmic divalent cation tolerance protein
MDSGNQAAPEDFIVVLITVPNQDVAATLANALVEEKLVACVNILPGVRSIYAWQGKICDDSELLCVLKTRRVLFAAVRDRVVALHPYEVPEIVALPLIEGNAPYLDWLQKETSAPQAPARGRGNPA